MRPLVPFISGLAGMFAAGTFMILSEAGPPGQRPKDEVSPHMAVETLIILFSTSALTGRVLYWLAGDRDGLQVLRREFGGQRALLLKLAAAVTLAGSIAVRLARGEALAMRDAASLAVVAILLLWSFAAWYHADSTPEGQGESPTGVLEGESL